MNNTNSSIDTLTGRNRLIYIITLAAIVLYLLVSFRAPSTAGTWDSGAFSKLPVLNGGRIKPLDTVARTSLLGLSGKQSLRLEDGSSMDATSWLLELMFSPEKANTRQAFEIDDPDVLGLLGLEQGFQRRFSFETIEPHMDAILAQARRADAIKPEERPRFEGAVMNLYQRISLYQKLGASLRPAGIENAAQYFEWFSQKLQNAVSAHKANPDDIEELLKEIEQPFQAYQNLANAAEFRMLPLDGATEDNGGWLSAGESVLMQNQVPTLHTDTLAVFQLGDAYRAGDIQGFNKTLQDFSASVRTRAAEPSRQAVYETYFNYYQPFYKSMVLYIAALLLVLAFWLTSSPLFSRLAFGLITISFALHSAGLLSRIILQGRPPVTNLYSSAVFVGWGAVALGLLLERMYRYGVGSAVAASIGFLTLIVAHHLAFQGDTMEMMRAVLDSNFWLATHVVTITIGYSSTFIAGFIGIIYLVRRAFDRRWTPEQAAALYSMAYGLVCFSAVFSFVGTVLGGIWADQSWGRFWGWDPKENGALMIVLWNLFILHARIGKFAGEKAIMTMTVFGNIITVFSWFGVNMLGIGLHSYGFMDKAFSWLLIFTASQLVVMGLGWWPERGTPVPHAK